MASARGFASLFELGFTCSPPISLQRRLFVPFRFHGTFLIKPSSRISVRIFNYQKNHSFSEGKPSKTREFSLFSSVELDQYVTSEDEEEEEEEMSEGFFEAIEELERMTREPSDILEEMNNRLSSRELQLVLVYFSQEGRDSWCALEVFEWLKKENRVDRETMELMVSIMCSWVKNLIEEERDAGEVFDLLIDMDCVGLKPGFSMIEKVISLYWEMGKKEMAVLFVKEVLRRKNAHGDEDNGELPKKGGPTGYLAWKMMVDGNYKDAVELVIHIRELGLKPEVYGYLIAMTAIVKELNELSKALRKLKGFTRAGLVANLDGQGVKLIENYQSDLLSNGLKLSNWAIQEGKRSCSILGVVHERLLAMYICAGRGVEAERQLWEMKLVGKQAESDLYDIVLAICASQNKAAAVSRLLTRIEAMGSTRKKKTLSWLLRGYVKGGHFDDAAKTLTRMIDLGLCPEYLDRAAVMQGMRKKIERPGDVEAYMDLCKRLFEAGLIGPCLVYLYIKRYNLWIVKMV